MPTVVRYGQNEGCKYEKEPIQTHQGTRMFIVKAIFGGNGAQIRLKADGYSV